MDHIMIKRDIFKQTSWLSVISFLLILAGTPDRAGAIPIKLLPEGLRSLVFEGKDFPSHCERDAIIGSLEERHPLEAIDDSLINLRIATCLSFKDAPPAAGLDQTAQGIPYLNISINASEPTLELLITAQNQGLPPVHQNFANLLEGLNRCKLADQARRDFENLGALRHRDFFCQQRRQASANLTEVDWTLAYFDIKSDENLPRSFSETKLIEAYGSCFEAVINRGLDTLCASFNGVRSDQIETIGQKAATSVVQRYIGSNASNKMTAMLKRKLDRMTFTLDNARGDINQLEAQAKRVDDRYETLQNAFDQYRSMADQIVEDYLTAANQAIAVEKERQRWIDGLLKDVSDELAMIARIEDVQWDDLPDRANDLFDHLDKLTQRPSIQTQQLKNLCHTYFCFFPTSMRREYTKTCAAIGNELCTRDIRRLNELSLSLDTESGLERKTVAAICAELGIAQRYIDNGASLYNQCSAELNLLSP